MSHLPILISNVKFLQLFIVNIWGIPYTHFHFHFHFHFSFSFFIKNILTNLKKKKQKKNSIKTHKELFLNTKSKEKNM